MVIELKAPKVKIGQKEIKQVELYANQIVSKTEFSKNNQYKVILISSHLNEYAKTEISSSEKPDLKNKFCYKRYNGGQVEIWIMTWMDIIDMNRKKLSYLGNVLKSSDVNTSNNIENELKEIKNNRVKARLATTVNTH